jgi:hypothetical protein
MRLQPVELPATVAPCRLTHPSLLALLDGTAAPAQKQGHATACAITLRYELELKLLSAMPGLRQEAARLLAARAAGSFLAIHPAAVRRAVERTPLVQLCERMAGNTAPDEAGLREAWELLQREAGAPMPAQAPDDRALAQARQLWPLAASVECLLAQGGDERLALDPATGLNRYGCAPHPRPDLVAFGSCTASSISPQGLLAAEALRRGLLAAALAGSAGSAIEDASRATADRLLAHFGVAGEASAMLVASGTDAALLITALIAAAHPAEPVTSIIMSPSETGSGVPEAVQAHHFSSVSASGEPVPKTAPLDGIPGSPALQTIALRDALGRPYGDDAIASACEAAVTRAAAVGHVVLHAIDGSKTGLTAPDRATCRRLQAAFGDRLSIVIDACQVRIEPMLIRDYVRHGCCVLITGSKFFAAPGFCGAVLAPLPLARRLAASGALPAGLRAYASGTGGLVARRCPGLLLRWAAALHSMQNFAAVPHDQVRAAIDRMGAAVRSMVMRNPRLSLVQAPRPSGAGWSDRSSVISFAVRSAEGAWLPAEALRPIYLALAADSSEPCQIGQPVSLGSPALGALRIAFSADQLGSLWDGGSSLRLVFSKLEALLC